jgi:hypothetical protein
MASDGAKHINFSHENCEKLICFAPSKTRIWQWQKKLLTIRNKIPATAKKLLHSKELVSNIRIQFEQ